ncbi:TTL [Symbiodinium natans]|uniref:TTL protein n=1 Tax=Symbiodinium natans TaxID=878477 RepID=A0A812MNP4_9DINO|nr:TTL [Symbiodinium natans]
MGPGDPASLYLLPAITGRCVEVLPRPIKLQRSVRDRVSRSRPAVKSCFTKEEVPKHERDLEGFEAPSSASPLPHRSASVLPLTDSWSTPSLSESSERTPSLRPFSASSRRDVGMSRLGPVEVTGEDRLALSAKDPKRRRRAQRRITTKNVERIESKTSSVREAKLKLFYVVQFGNNSGLIRDLLKHRRIWFPGPGDPGYLGRRQEAPCTVKVETATDAPEIQLLWSQYVVRDFLNAMAEEQQGWIVSYNDENRIRLEQREGAAGSAGSRVHNHFEKNALISSKAGLRETMVGYYRSHGRDPFGAIPLTFVVRAGSTDPEFAQWRESFEELRAANETVWLVKPGDKANQGKGIVVCDSAEEVQDAIDSKSRVWVIQKYIEKPFLIHKRKFDIRSYCLLAQDPSTGALHGYFYRQAYLRTTSAAFTLATKDRFVHLNNDAVQKHGEGYGKYEAANKMSLSEFQSYLDVHHGRECLSIHGALLPQMKALMADTLRAVGTKINPRGIQHCFEVFGFDFMVDENFRVWLIEVNTNPSLDLCCSLLMSMIPKMLDEALSLSLDKIFGDSTAAHTAWEPIYSSEERAEEAASDAFVGISLRWLLGYFQGWLR